MAKIPKPPKGGRRKATTQPPGSTPAPRVTAEMLALDAKKYKDLMWKPYQVKSPEGMETDENYLNQIDILKVFSELDVKSGVLDRYNTLYGGHETYEECMQLSHDNMTMILLETLSTARLFSDMEDPYDRGFVHLLEAIVSLYNGNPYSRDRIGWFMWAVARHISPSCYFPLTLDLYYDPRLWHRPGQKPKPPLEIPPSVYLNGGNQEFGPEDDIWSCELPDTGQRE